jgi:DNA-binding response OmpR family regulator
VLKLLIADTPDAFLDALVREFASDFQLIICHDGIAVLQALQSFQPDAMILNFFLVHKDGLAVLEGAPVKPRVILGMTPYLNEYTAFRASQLGVQYIMRLPTSIHAVRSRLTDLLNGAPDPDAVSQTVALLHRLNFYRHLDSYRQLCLGIPLFAKNPGMRMGKELYAIIAQQMDIPDTRAVEHSIRKSIGDAWLRRDPEVWNQYFPNKNSPPTNKEFIACLAEHINHACHFDTPPPTE